MNTLTVTLPDGTTASRKSDRPYTHAIVVIKTDERRALILGNLRGRIEACHAVIRTQTPLAATPDAAAAYTAAVARVEYLREEVRDVGSDGKPNTWTSPRWLSDEYKASRAGERTRDHIDAAQATLAATPRAKVDEARSNLKHLEADYSRQSAEYVVGAATVYGWSMSDKSARAMADKARKDHPGAKVTITTEIAVHTPKSRKA